MSRWIIELGVYLTIAGSKCEVRNWIIAMPSRGFLVADTGQLSGEEGVLVWLPAAYTGYLLEIVGI